MSVHVHGSHLGLTHTRDDTYQISETLRTQASTSCSRNFNLSSLSRNSRNFVTTASGSVKDVCITGMFSGACLPLVGLYLLICHSAGLFP